MSQQRKIAVLDVETDPFMHGRTPRPFCCEFYSDEHTAVFWGDDCMDQFASYAEKLADPHLIYAHNGGKFDFHFMADYIDNPLKIINARIVSAGYFEHILRDSYAILPVPLRDYEKDVFDYAKMERPVRERHKTEILHYLHSDCVSLYKLVTAFIDQFGVRLTIGGTAMREIKKRYKFDTFDKATDATFRRFYYGGRVQCFKTGILKGPFNLYDINSQYPYVMKTRKHPVNGIFDICDKRPRSFKMPYFLRFIGKNYNAIPARADNGSLIFDRERGEFFACSHELEVALDYGLVEIDKVLECYLATETITFDDYVNEFFAMKQRAEAAGDKAGRLFAKLLLNSAYGKFGQNPENFLDYILNRDSDNDEQLQEDGYELAAEYPQFTLWQRASEDSENGLFDVSIAASVTSAARSVLLDGLQRARNPIYCDTDSIICETFSGEISATNLGAFKWEAKANRAAIAGKKMYALYDDAKAAKAIKLASKGGNMQLRDIIEMCKGGIVEQHRESPSFSITRGVTTDPRKLFITRKFRMTGAGVDKSPRNAPNTKRAPKRRAATTKRK